jgi:hypothetical protein
LKSNSPIGLERVERRLTLLESGERAQVEVGIDEETEMRRLAHQGPRKRRAATREQEKE